MKKPARKSRPASSRISPAPVTTPSESYDAAVRRRIADAPRRGRREAAMIAAALEALPALNRAEMGSELFPFNEVASADPVQAVIEKLVRQRAPDNSWNGVHGPMCKTDHSGNGYWAWIDVFRDAAFLVGVDYAMRSMPELPDWWGEYQKLHPDLQNSIGVLVRYAAETRQA